MVMDQAQAQQLIAETKAKIAALDAEIENLPGKENKKARNTKSREIADLKNGLDYVDAERVVDGKEPLQAHNKSAAEAPKAEEQVFEAPKEHAFVAPKETTKKEKKPKKEESAGISPSERRELEDLKNQLIQKKKALKEEGMTGGQMNKDPEIVSWVTRMNELKEKAGELTDKKAAKENKKGKKGGGEEVEKLKREIEEYSAKLAAEFGYSKSEIKKDEDIIEMTKRMNAMKA